MSERFRWTAFSLLSGAEVHDLLRLRQDVFVVEQACAFPEIDGRDPQAEHLLVHREASLAGCLRLFLDEDVRIGRVATAPSARGTGLGHRMMEAALARAAARRPGRPILLAAQAHLSNFYARHGFIPAGDAYLEDGIAHVDMRREA